MSNAAEELLQSGRVEESLASLQESIRNDASNLKLRVFLFQMLCVLGRWERALTQLQLMASLNSDTMLLAQVFRGVIQCEALRHEIFSGKRAPIIFGEPLEWVSWLVQANELVAEGKLEAAAQLRDKAFEAAPAAPGKLNGQPFEWVADADPRLGPVLEVILEGNYYWVPFCRIQKLYLEPPTDLRDLVWAPVQFQWTNGGEATGHVPARYAGTEASKDPSLLLARKTDWRDLGHGYAAGLGQRMLATNEADVALLECRTIEFTAAEATPAASAS